MSRSQGMVLRGLTSYHQSSLSIWRTWLLAKPWQPSSRMTSQRWHSTLLPRQNPSRSRCWIATAQCFCLVAMQCRSRSCSRHDLNRCSAQGMLRGNPPKRGGSLNTFLRWGLFEVTHSSFFVFVSSEGTLPTLKGYLKEYPPPLQPKKLGQTRFCLAQSEGSRYTFRPLPIFV